MNNKLTRILMLIVFISTSDVTASLEEPDVLRGPIQISDDSFCATITEAELRIAISLTCKDVETVHQEMRGLYPLFKNFDSPTHPVAGWVVDTGETVFIAINDPDSEISRKASTGISHTVGTIALGLSDIGTVNQKAYELATNRWGGINVILDEDAALLSKRFIVTGFGNKGAIAQVIMPILRKKCVDSGVEPNINGIFFSTSGPFDSIAALEMQKIFVDKVIYLDIRGDLLASMGSHRIHSATTIIVGLKEAGSSVLGAAASGPRELVESVADRNYGGTASILGRYAGVAASYIFGGAMAVVTHVASGNILPTAHWPQIYDYLNEQQLLVDQELITKTREIDLYTGRQRTDAGTLLPDDREAMAHKLYELKRQLERLRHERNTSLINRIKAAYSPPPPPYEMTEVADDGLNGEKFYLIDPIPPATAPAPE